jgi:predicted metal-dependent enzyme (double-stranded beta helix superfamily)
MFDLDRFIGECRSALTESSPELAVKELLAEVMSRPSEVEARLGAPWQGEVITLHRSADLTVLNVIWSPCMTIYPHDHRIWAVIGLYGGQEDNTFYRRGPTGLVVVGQKELRTSDAVVLGHAVIHAVTNPLKKLTGAIHVYGGDFFAVSRSEWDPGTLEERPYDVERAKRVFADANERWRVESAAPGRSS